MKTKLLIFYLFCLADQYYYYTAKEKIMFDVYGNVARKQLLNFQVKQITDGTKKRIYAGLKSPSQKK